ncbi:MAG: cysteine desulfurase NifS [Candidatus Nanoarchaeia archaeon]
MKVYLDNGATTKVADEVAKTMQEYMTKKYGNASSLHSFGEEASEALEKARSIIARKINAEPDEIIFTSGGTESDNLAIKGVAHAGNKKHIITTRIEHPAVLKTCETLQKEGYKITYLRVDKEGFISLKELEEAITPDTAIVSVIHANNEIGTIQDIAKIGEICKKKNVVFHTDAVQSFTKVPIDVKKINIDLISLSAHKIHGPKGIGALYVRKGTKLRKMIDGGPHEKNLRAGTENVAGAVGFGKAVELTNDKDIKKMEKLRDKLIEGILKKIPDTMLNGSRTKRLCNNANITFKGIEGESMLLLLNEKGIAVSTGSACSSKSLEPSHVLLAIGLKHEEAHGSIRFTLSRYTTQKEIEHAVKAAQECAKKLRQISPLWRKNAIH